MKTAVYDCFHDAMLQHGVSLDGLSVPVSCT